MRVPNLGETELLVPLHEGMFEQPMWDTFLGRLKSVTGCRDATLLVHAPDSVSALQLSTGAPAERPHLQALFVQRFDASGALQPRAMREGRVYTLDELLERADETQRRIVREVLLPAGLTHLRAMRIGEPSGMDAWLVLTSRESIPASASSLLAALFPHLRAALQVFAHLERARGHASINAGAFSHINFGWIAVDRRCHVVDMDEQAERFLSRTSAIRQDRYGRLTPSAARIDRELTALVKAFADEPDARARALNICEDPWTDILVSPVRVASLSPGGTAVAAIYFRGDQSSSADRCQQLVDLFKLTQSEARFAWWLAQGISITEAAARHGLTIESARVYSKRIYSKAGASGQVDFMRRVLTSVIALTVR